MKQTTLKGVVCFIYAKSIPTAIGWGRISSWLLHLKLVNSFPGGIPQRIAEKLELV